MNTLLLILLLALAGGSVQLGRFISKRQFKARITELEAECTVLRRQVDTERQRHLNDVNGIANAAIQAFRDRRS